MKQVAIILSIFIFITLSFSRSDRSVVKGSIVGADGKPMPAAHIQVISNEPNNPQVLRSIGIGKDGNFELTLDSPGFWKLSFSGVNHYPLIVPLFLDNNDDVILSIKLKAFQYVNSFGAIEATGDANNYSTSDGTQPMTYYADTTYRATLNNVSQDTIGFQILGAELTGLPVASLECEKYVFSEDGSYRSVIRTQGGPAVVTFDPKEILHDSSDAVVKFQNTKSLAARFYAFHTDLQKRRDQYTNAYNAHIAAGKQPNNFIYDWSKDLADVKKSMKSEKDETFKNAWLLASVEFGALKEDSSVAATVMTTVPATSPLWSYFPGMLYKCISTLEDQKKYIPYLEKVIDEHPDQAIKSIFISGMLNYAVSQADTATIVKYYQRLINDYDNTHWVQAARARFEQNPILKPGTPVPEFSFNSISDTSVYTDKKLVGMTYLINFWATSSKPSIADLQNINDAFEKFKGQGFNVLSVSFDNDQDDVAKFRKGNLKMPWMNACLKDGWENDVAKKFGVLVVPTSFLVARDGKIFAIGDDLRGDKLVETLTKIYGKQ